MISSDPDLDSKVKKTTERVSENMHIVANDPSLAFYRIQEHVRKVMPMIVERRAEVLQLQSDLQGHCYDMEYAIGAVKQVNESEAAFKSAQELLKNAIFLKQQLKCEEQKRRGGTATRDTSSVYKRLSAHIQTTLDLPDLDLSGVMRETTSRVENMMRNAPPATASGSGNATGDLIQRSHTTLH